MNTEEQKAECPTRPNQSSDLNPIENSRHYLKSAVSDKPEQP